MELTPEATEQAGMPCVAERIATRVRADGNLESEDGPDADHGLERRTSDQTALQPMHLRCRNPTLASHRPKAQSGTSAGNAKFATETHPRGPTVAPRAVKPIIARRHWTQASQTALTCHWPRRVSLSARYGHGTPRNGASGVPCIAQRAMRQTSGGAAAGAFAWRNTGSGVR